MTEANTMEVLPPSVQAPPEYPFSTPVTTAVCRDDSDEWEYEYSTTETETYYVTLDLSGNVPTKAPAIKRHGGRGAYHQSKWKNPGLGRHKRQLGRITGAAAESATFGTAKGSTAGRETLGKLKQDDPENENDDDGEAKNDVSESDPSGGQQEPAEEKNSKIQILDLHSDNPIISYCGQVYSCEWAENIGTELLFTIHDPENPLPVLRSLPDGVDLLGAISARILSTAVDMAPKGKAQDAQLSDRWTNKEHNRFVPGLSIPVSMAASDKRKSQAKFLEALMNIKQAKGEADKVTINLQKRQTNAAWKRQIEEQRNEERINLRKMIEKGDGGAEDAQRRLEYMDDQDRESRASNKGKRGPKRKITEVTPPDNNKRVIRRRPRGGMPPILYQRQESLISDTPGPVEGSHMMSGGLNETASTPTPTRWTDLETGSIKDARHDEDE
ncbi:hypothetical protein F5884DRAFT_63591 [Xylogone sp. PMI_703]|nr:hypothetical protein F5884DRAFT_63591 [Xylogone sp. PMI_703]